MPKEKPCKSTRLHTLVGYYPSDFETDGSAIICKTCGGLDITFDKKSHLEQVFRKIITILE